MKELFPQTLFSSKCTFSLRLVLAFICLLVNGDLTTRTRALSHLNPPANGELSLPDWVLNSPSFINTLDNTIFLI